MCPIIAHPLTAASAPQAHDTAAHRNTVWSRRRRIISDSSDGAKTPSHSARKKERARGENFLEVERGKLGRIARPVARNHRTSGVADQSLKRKDEQKDVIDFPDEGNEIGNKIER